MVVTPTLQILTIACLTFCLLLTYSPIQGLTECKVKVFNNCEMHGTGGCEFVVFDRNCKKIDEKVPQLFHFSI